MRNFFYVYNSNDLRSLGNLKIIVLGLKGEYFKENMSQNNLFNITKIIIFVMQLRNMRFKKTLICLVLALCNYLNAQPPYFPNGAPQITATPPPPWAPGTTVTFSITIDNYNSNPSGISEWFHGLGIIPGSCWTNLVYGTPPPAYTNGVWMVDLNPMPPKTGGPPIPGFYFDGTAGSTSGFIDGITANNWGDGSGSGPWTFTWTVTVPNTLPNPCDLSMAVRVFGDGETGSWTQLPPGTQPLIIFQNTITVFCTNQPVTLPFSPGTPNPTFTYQWDLTGATLLAGNPNSYGPVTVSFPNPGSPFVRRFSYDGLGNLMGIDTFTVNVVQAPLPSFTVSQGAICEGDTVTITYTGNTDPSFSYNWNFLGGTVITGSGAGPYTVVFNNAVDDSLKLVVSNSACSDSFKVRFLVKPIPNSNFTIGGKFCVNDTITFNYPFTVYPGMNFQWNFGSGLVVSGQGPGPYQVIWASPQQDSVKLTVSWNGCFSSTSTIFNIKQKPIVDAGIDYAKCSNTPCVPLTATLIQGGPNCSYQWTPSTGLDNPNVLNPCASPNVTTTYYLVATCGGCPSLADSVTVYVHPAPVASIASDTVYFCQGTSVTLPGAASGGTGSLSVQWSPTNGLSNPFILNPVASPSSPQWYYMTITDSMGCVSSTDSVFVNIAPIPVVNAGADTFICFNASNGVTLNGTVLNPLPGETFTYSWSPTNGLSDPTIPNPIAMPSTTTIYTLTVTSNLTGCTSVPSTLDSLAVVVVNVLPEVVANAGPDKTICEGQGTMIGDIAAGGSGYTYLWTPSNGLSDPTVRNPFANPSVTTTYTLTVFSDKGCISQPDAVTVNVINAPTEINLIDFTLCPGDSLLLDPDVQTNMPYTVRWSPGTAVSDSTALNPYAIPTQTTTYEFYVRIDTCEFLTKTFTITVVDTPVIEATVEGIKEVVICEGQTVNLQGIINGNYDSFTWSPSLGLSDPNSLTPTANPTQSTVYYFEVSYQGCLNRDSVVVAVMPPITADIQPDSLDLCQGKSATLTASGGIGSASFTWYADGVLVGTGNSLNITPNATTEYILEVREGSCIARDTLKVQVNQQPTAEALPSTYKGCAELTVSFLSTSTQATAHEWNFGDGNVSNETNPVHTFETPGSYIVQLVTFGTGGCSDTTYLNIFVSPQAEAHFHTEPDYQAGPVYLPNAQVFFIDSSQNAVRWFWDFGDGNISFEQNPVHEYLLPGNYTVTLIVEDDGGCLDTVSISSIIVEEPTYILPNVFTPNGDGVNDVFRFDYKGKESFSFQIYDRHGRKLFETQQPNQGWNGNTNFGPAVEGVYYYVLQIGKKKITGNVTLLR